MKAWWHLEAGKDSRFAEMLVETARAIRPDLTIIDGIIGHQGNGPSGGEPRHLGILGAAADVFALDEAVVEILAVDPTSVPTIAASRRLGLSSSSNFNFPYCSPAEMQVLDWKLPDTLSPIDFGVPRILRSTLKHAYIRLIQEPLGIYGTK